MKNYAQIVKDNQKKNESPNKPTENVQQIPCMILPNQKFVKILVNTQNQTGGANSFQNVFLNLIPTTNLTNATTPTITDTTTKTKDTNQNVFLNINNTFQKFVPIAPNDGTKKDLNKTVNQLLTESKTEELSVELDPLDFTLDESEDRNELDEGQQDWDELISPSKIDSKRPENGVNGNKPLLLKHNNYVPILPKQDEFSSSGQHFLSPAFESSGGEFACERCKKTFHSMVRLRNHIKLLHMEKMPFKCDVCSAEYFLRSDYENCLKRHGAPAQSLTLQDFPSPAPDITDEELKPTESGEYVCDICKRLFNSSTGLLRHKVRKHNQKNKKKYFIKGVKNARCDICNREFSTQSYMQLHRKLHLRDDIGYKYKVFGRSKYGAAKKDEEPNKEGDKESEAIDVTPDIVLKPEEESDEEGETKPDIKMEYESDAEEKNENENDNDDDSDEGGLKMDLQNGEQSDETNEKDPDEEMSEEN